MDLHHALTTRRTVHRFVPGTIPEEVLHRALAAATFAPNHKLTWPWRFALPGPQARSKLADLNVDLKSAARALTVEMQMGIRDKMASPDRLIVISQQLAGDPFREQEDYATCACAIHNLMLSFHADGLHSKWSTGAVTRHADTYRLLQVDPQTERIVGFVWAGHAQVVPTAAPRPSWREVTRTIP